MGCKQAGCVREDKDTKLAKKYRSIRAHRYDYLDQPEKLPDKVQ